MATYYTNKKLNNLLEVSERNIVRVLVMVGYGYEIRSYNTYNGVTPIAEKWKNPSYAESDHVARRLEQPFGSTESYGVKSERIIEQVHTPIMTEYNRISPVEYGVERSRWRAVPSAVDDRTTKVEEFITQVQTEVAQPNLVRPGLVSQGGRQWKPLDAHSTSPDYKHNSYPSSDPLLEGYSKVQTEVPRSPMTRPGLVSDGTRYPRDVYSPPPAADYKSSHTPSEYGGRNNTWGRASSPVRDAEQNRSSIRPGFLSNISRRPEQLQPFQAPLAEYKRTSNSPPEEYRRENNPWVRKSQPGLLRSDNWHQTPNSTPQTAPTGYDSYNNYKGKEMDNAPEYNKYVPTEPSIQPARSTWTRPVLGGWATTTTQVTPLTRPTNNIKEAVNYLAGALQQSSLTHTAPQQYYDTSGTPKMDHYSETIDSREAQSRYGSLSGSSRGRETYSTTIDSREALRKYGGAAV
ncbi:hypothetical protein QQ045_023763 [Rhodiola kirilowii]